MATVIGSLRVLLGLNQASFRSGMRGARRQMGSFQSTVQSVQRGLLKLGGAVAAAFAVRRIRNIIREQREALDAFAKLSDRIDIQAQKLFGLELAASQAGISFEELSKGLEMMRRRVGEALQGTGEAVDAFELLGIDLQRIRSLRADEQFAMIADAVRGLGDANLQASASADVFGRAGVKLLNLISGGSEGLREFQREAERLGLVFNRIDLANIESLNDEWDKVGRTFRAAAQRAAVELAPSLFEIANQVLQLQRETSTLSDVIESAFRGMERMVLSLGEAFDRFAAGLKLAQANALEVFAFFRRPLDPLRALTGLGGPLSRSIRMQAQELRDEADRLLQTLPTAERIFKRFEAAQNRTTLRLLERLQRPRIPGLSEEEAAGFRGRFGIADPRELGLVPGQPLGGGIAGQVPANIKRMTQQLDTIIDLFRRGALFGPAGLRIA